jgi:hypothetical protein
MKVERPGHPVYSAPPETKSFEAKLTSADRASRKGTQQNTSLGSRDGNILRKIFPCLRRPKNKLAGAPGGGWQPHVEPHAEPHVEPHKPQFEYNAPYNRVLWGPPTKEEVEEQARKQRAAANIGLRRR